MLTVFPFVNVSVTDVNTNNTEGINDSISGNEAQTT